ncbi:MAG: sterol desaturase family protein [Hyphomicrobiaceae bacterium]
MRLSQISYYADFAICFALVAFMGGCAAMLPSWLQRAEWVFYLGAGAVAWTFVEYLVHRWLYHHVPYFKTIHEMHHAEPEALIGAPPVIGVVLVFSMFYVPVFPFNPIAASGVAAGALIGYTGYMLVHHAAHFWSVPQGTWLYEARRHHALHHFHSEECNFGIITSFWDHMFGTAVVSSRRVQGKDRVTVRAR